MVKWPGCGKRKAKWFALADGKVRHPLDGYSTKLERGRLGAGGTIGLVQEVEGEFEFEVDFIIEYSARRNKYLVSSAMPLRLGCGAAPCHSK